MVLAALRELRPMSEISRAHQISPNQILLIASKEQSICELIRSEYFKLAEKMPLKNGTYPRMENILYQWYLKNPGNYKSAEYVEKARNILSITEEKPIRGSRMFVGTATWTSGFKKRYDITFDKPLRAPTLEANNSSVSPVVNEQTGEMVDDIKTEKSANESNTMEGIFYSPSTVEVHITENSNQQNVTQALKANEDCVLNTAPIELVTDNEPKSPKQNKRQPAKRNKRVNTMSPNWALQVFTQALKWTKENPTDEADVRVLRKLHSRCILSMNNIRKIKSEKQ